jgi:hypothetical protein
MDQLPIALKMAEQHKETQATGQVDLFALAAAGAVAQPDPQLAVCTRGEWEEEQRLQGEKENPGPLRHLTRNRLIAKALHRLILQLRLVLAGFMIKA